jgi:hypothetical protein
MEALLRNSCHHETPPNNGIHPTRATLPLINLNLVGGRVMPSVGLLIC